MRLTATVLTFATVSVILTPRVVRAGGQQCTDREGDIADRANRKWKKRGARAIPAMIRALCSKNGCLNSFASERLEALSIRAVGPLFKALKQKPCHPLDPEHPAGSTLAESLCVNVRPGAGWKRIQSRIIAAVGSNNKIFARNAMDVLGHVAGQKKYNCPRRASLTGFVNAGLGPIARIVASPTHPLNKHALGTLRSYGKHASPAAAALGKLLDRNVHVSHVLEALKHIGPGAAAAVPALRKLMNRSNIDRKVRIAAVLGRIGPAALPARKELFALASFLMRKAKNSSTAGFRLINTVEALARIGGLWSAAERAILVTVLRTDAFGFQARLRAARALKNTVFGPFSAELHLIRLVLRKEKLNNAQHTPVPQKPPPPAVRAARFLSNALTVCANEAKLSSGSTTPSVCGVASMNAGQTEKLADCISQRICGPNRKTYRRAVSACCKRARRAKSTP